MRVLVCSSYYWPEESGNAPYVTGLAEYLSDLGFDITVATSFAHYPAWQLSEGSFARTDFVRGVRVRRRRHYVPRRQSALRRGLYELSVLSSGLSAIPMANAPELVIGVTPTLAGGLLASWAARVYRAPLVLVAQDVLGLAASQSGVAGGARVSRVVTCTEQSLARRAKLLAIVAEGFRPYFESGGVKRDRIYRLRNWSPFVEPTESVAETRRRFGWAESDFVCLHAGNMGQKQGLSNVLMAAKAVDDQRIRIVLAGDGNDRRRLEDEASRLQLGNVDFADFQAMGGPCEAMLRAADLLLVNQRGEVSDMSLPSKLTTYFAAGRPVLAAASANSETAKEIGAAGAGRTVAPDNPRELASAICSFSADDPKPYGSSALSYVKTTLSRDAILGAFADRLAETVEKTFA